MSAEKCPLFTDVCYMCKAFDVTVLLERVICETVDQSIASIKSRWYKLQSDVKSVLSVLEETVENWRQCRSFSSVLLTWLPLAEQVLHHRTDGWQVDFSLCPVFVCYRLFVDGKHSVFVFICFCFLIVVSSLHYSRLSIFLMASELQFVTNNWVNKLIV